MADKNSMTITRSRIETSIPRKHGPAIAGYESVCVFRWIYIMIDIENMVVLRPY